LGYSKLLVKYLPRFRIEQAGFNMPTKAQSHTTTDHDEIRRWAEARDAKPACVKGTGGSHDIGILRLDFPGYSGEDKLQHISWEDWFNKFDERELALLFQEQTAAGAESNFNKIVSRETAAENEKSSHHKSKTKK
jgi:hypothetical protein